MAEHNTDSRRLTLPLTSKCEIRGEEQRFTAQFKERKDGIGDLTVIINGKSSKVHSAILTDKSDYFKAMLLGGFSETKATSVDLSKTFDDVDELNTVFDYMYTGEITLSEGNISSVLNTASLLLMTGLQTACSEFLITNIAPSTCIPIFILAERYSLLKVYSACLEVIKAWFQFLICCSKEAIEMPPKCLEVLMSENVFELVANDVMQTFLEKWHQHFENNYSGSVSLPPEVEELLKSSRDDFWRAEDKVDEDVLITVFSPPDSDPNCIEIFAFVPKMKSWKLLVRHTFSDILVSKKIVRFIGVTDSKAFFVVCPEDYSSHEESVVSVNMQTKEERLFRLPKKVYTAGILPPYILWSDSLCSIYSADLKSWSLYKNEHESVCSEKCTSKCWVPLCKLPAGYLLNKKIATKEYQSKLYVWIQDMHSEVKMSFFCISKYPGLRKKFTVVKIPPPELIGDDEFFSFDLCEASCISVDQKNKQLQFTSKFDEGETLLDFKMCPHSSHKEYNFVYDVAENKWKECSSRYVVYPKDVPRVLEVTRNIMYYERMYISEDASEEADLEDVSEQNDPEDGSESGSEDGSESGSEDGSESGSEDFCKGYVQEAYMHWYFARSTSPYNTCIWKVEADGKEWQLLTHAPCPLASLRFLKTDEVSTEYLKALPNACFEDFSAEIGHSAVTNMNSPKTVTDFDMTFYGEQLDYKSYDSKWGDLWELKINDAVN